jgi:ABC-2 type transport system permease protein
LKLPFLTIYWREMIRFTRFRALLISSLLQPALWMAFFGIAMSSNFSRFGVTVGGVEGVLSVDYLTFMAAGVIAMTTLFTSLFGGMSLLFDKTFGLMPEILGSPIPRTHVIIGIGLSGMTKAFIQVLIILVFGLLIGVEFFAGMGPVAVLSSIAGIIVFSGVFSLGFIFLSSAIAMRMESHEGLQGVITLLSMPIFFTSNALYPVEAFPPLLKALSLINPLTYLVNGVRYFTIGGHFYSFGTEYLYSSMDILVSFLVLVIFAGITFSLAYRSVQKLSIV